MRYSNQGIKFSALLAAAHLAFSFGTAAQQVPQQLQPPAGEQLLLQVHAKGDQICTCKGDAAQFAWTLKAPDAQLFDKDGKPSANISRGLPGKLLTVAASRAKRLQMYLRRTPTPSPGFSSIS